MALETSGAGVVRLCGKLFAFVLDDGVSVRCCAEGHEDTRGVDACVGNRKPADRMA
jgi:hypothetical protein